MEAENKYCYAELQKTISAIEEGQTEQNKGKIGVPGEGRVQLVILSRIIRAAFIEMTFC